MIIERRTQKRESSDLPYIEYADIIPNIGRLNKDIFSRKNTKHGIYFQKNDILFGKLRPYLNNWLKPQFEGIAVGDFWILNGIKLNNDFLYYYIQTKKFSDVANVTTGTKMPRADWNLVSNLKIKFPNFEEQQNIGKLLYSLEKLITLYERKIKLFDNMIAYLKQQLFYKQSSLSFPQSHWKDIAFSKLYIKRKDKNIDASYDQSKTISVANMKYSDRELNSSREYLKTYYITHFGDIIYEGNRSGNFKYGRFVQNNIGDGIVSHVFTVYKPINDLDINFMNNFINYEPIMSRVLLYATTDTLMMHTLHDNELMKQKLSLPDKETQIKIGKILSLVSTIKNRFSERKELLIKIKNTLLNTMFI